MKNIMRLKARGLLTEQQVLAAYKFARAPQAYRIAPTIYRVLHDAVIKEEPLEAMERRRGWPARSAKAIIGLFLHALQEMGATHEDPEGIADLRERVAELTADDDAPALARLIDRYGFRRMEARLFLLLERAEGAAVSVDRIMSCLYGDRIDDPPDADIVRVMVWKMRDKLRGGRERIDTVRGVGYRLARLVDEDRALWYAEHVLEAAPIRDIAERHDSSPAAVLRGIWTLINEQEDDAIDAMAREALSARDAASRPDRAVYDAKENA